MESASIASAPAQRACHCRPVWRMARGQQAFITTLLLIGLRSWSAVRAQRPMSVVPEYGLTNTSGKLLVTAWQQRLGEYIARFGSGDPAVLSHLPALCSTGTLRPARITFGVIDIDAVVP